MRPHTDQTGQGSLTSILVLIGLVVAAVWVWNKLDYDTQDFIVEDVVPIGFLVLAVAAGVWLVVNKVKERLALHSRKQRLIARFQMETSAETRLDVAFALVELNAYKVEGLESVETALTGLLRQTLTTALGDKQHRIRGMAASHLGVMRDLKSAPLLMKALEDDHAYVRGCAALALGRMRVSEAKEKLAYVMKEDWDQTVRSRAREALERLA